MFKFLVVAALASVALAQGPLGQFNRFGSPFASGLFNPYNRGINGLGGLGVNGLGVNGLGVNGLGGLGGLNNYYNRGGLFGGDYYNRGLFGGDYYNRGLLDGRAPFNDFRGLPAVRPPVVAPIRSAVGGAEAGARILSQSNDITPDGAYQYQYETENGIAAAEQNIPRVNPNTGEVINTVQGTYSYVAPTGEQIAVSYVADENGFQPQLQDGSGRAAPVAPLSSAVRRLPAPLRARARVFRRN